MFSKQTFFQPNHKVGKSETISFTRTSTSCNQFIRKDDNYHDSGSFLFVTQLFCALPLSGIKEKKYQ